MRLVYLQRAVSLFCQKKLQRCRAITPHNSLVLSLVVFIKALDQTTSAFFLVLSLPMLALLLLGDRTGEDFSLSHRLTNIEVPPWGLFSGGACIVLSKLRVGHSNSVLLGLERYSDGSKVLKKFGRKEQLTMTRRILNPSFMQ